MFFWNSYNCLCGVDTKNVFWPNRYYLPPLCTQYQVQYILLICCTWYSIDVFYLGGIFIQYNSAVHGKAHVCPFILSVLFSMYIFMCSYIFSRLK